MKGSNGIKLKQFIVFTIIVGLIVAIFSVVSDNLPRIEDLTIIQKVLVYLATMLNSLPMWFIVAMFVGYYFAINLRQAAVFAMLYTLFSISLYLFIFHFHEDIPENLSISIMERVMGYLGWLVASALGGLFGGIVGFLLKKSHYVLLILLAGLILQLFVSGKSSWSNWIAISENVTFCLMIVGIIIYLLYKKLRKTSIYVIEKM